MARLQLHRPLLLPVCVLLLATAGVAASAAAAAEAPERKVRVTTRYVDEEEARWLDHSAETHQPLGSGGGRFTVKPATEDMSAWLNRFSDATMREREAHDGEDAHRDDGYHHVEFDHDDAHGRVVQVFLSRLARMREDLDKSRAEEEQDTKDL